MPNRLAAETSPYLLQHSDNPVDWYPWGEEALARARADGRPILVSIGYSACHWCHVMAHESFEDPAVAAVMNEHFVCVKVDREERPDVDAIYMEACIAMSGQGGWPLNAFLTPEQVPFYAGTYFPPVERHGLPSWRRVLEAIAEAWKTRGDEIRAGSARIAERLRGGAALTPSEEPLDASLLTQGEAALRQAYDPEHGGFGAAPKFPQASTIELLLRRGEREIALHSLRAMACGGIYDQVGGGFARYSVDAAWQVPHFEKMLYDNALLARAYLHAWQLTGDELMRRVCDETLQFLLRDLLAPEGGFMSAIDADSEGGEGAFYVWTLGELRDVLGHDADAAIAYFGATEAGNFEGSNILMRRGPEPPRLPEIRCRLFGARSGRPHPAVDDKRIASWNALAIAALAESGGALGRREYVDAAARCAGFVLDHMRTPEGRLQRTFNRGRAHLDAYLEDHAFLVEALLTLYEATFEPRWFREARAIADTMIERFADRERGGFFETASDHEQLIARRKDLEDNPIPSGNSSAAFGLLRLAALTGEHQYFDRADGVLQLLHPVVGRHPQAFAHLLQAIDFRLAPVKEVALAGADTSALERVVRGRFRPHIVLAGGEPDGVPLLTGRAPVDGRSAAYVCEQFACRRPATEPDELAALLDDE